MASKINLAALSMYCNRLVCWVMFTTLTVGENN